MVIITHADLGKELSAALQFILGHQDQIETVSVVQSADSAGITAELKAAIKRADQGRGVLVLTDMFGGTPNNISLALMQDPKVEVVTGVNLPMVIRAATARRDQDTSLADLAHSVCQTGREAISVASELLEP